MVKKAFLFSALLFAFSSFGLAQHHDHDHHDEDELHFSHPLFVESPSPDTKVRFDYFYTRINEDGERISDHTPRIEAEYAFKRSFSIEINVPYTFRRSSIEPSQSHFDTVDVGLKFASYAFEKHHILPTYGVEFEFPTGNSTGIGSNHIATIEPFAGLGYKHKKLELIGIASVGIPVNTRPDDEGKEFAFGFAALYKVTHHIQPLIELEASRALTGPNQGESVVNIAPGIKFLPKNHHWQIGIGTAFPVTSGKEFKVRTVFSVFYHF